jgi:hypothetical protein
LQQVEDRGVIQPRADDAFQRGVNLGQQSADAVADLGDLRGEVVVEPAEHRQLGDLLVRDLDRAERVRHRASRLGDDRGVSCVGLRLTGVQVRDPTHRQPRQIPGDRSCGLRDRNGQCADGRGLVNDQQHDTVRLEFREHAAEALLVVGQCLVVELLAGAVEGDGVVFAFADVESDEHVDLVVSVDIGDHCSSVRSVRQRAAVRLGIHVTNDLERARAWPLSAITHRRPGPVTTPPRIMGDRGDQSCRARQAATAQHGR